MCKRIKRLKSTQNEDDRDNHNDDERYHFMNTSYMPGSVLGILV